MAQKGLPLHAFTNYSAFAAYRAIVLPPSLPGTYPNTALVHLLCVLMCVIF